LAEKRNFNFPKILFIKNYIKTMKLTFGIIVLNGDFFLQQVLESIYPFAHAICIAEGPVQWFVDKGITQSSDDTFRIIKEFPDPENKIKLVQGQYKEKHEQCQAWFSLVPPDTDYIVCNDADEIHTPENLAKLIHFLQTEKPTSVGFKSDSFYGGFERIIGGFERDHSFKRVLQYIPGCYYRTHRQPTLAFSQHDGIHYDERLNTAYTDIEGKDVSGNQLYAATGITMWHGSYISPKGVFQKLQYYEGAIISAGNCIPNYFQDVFIPWVTQHAKRHEIEDKWLGVQEFIPSARGYQETRTIPYPGTMPAIIQRDMQLLQDKFYAEMALFSSLF